MGILNLTPDSFSDGGRVSNPEIALRKAQAMVRDGARIVDVGGESTRPGAEPVSTACEIERVIPTIEALSQARLSAVISIDTSKAQVAKLALQAGAEIVNDVTALSQRAMAPTVAEAGGALILMHMRGEPQTMQETPIHYSDVVREVAHFLENRVGVARDAGLDASRIMVDPGIGFGKSLQHNLALTSGLGTLRTLGYPVVYGPSRKRFLGDLTQRSVGDRDRATAAACVAAVLAGADVLRVHDPAAVIDAVRVATALRDGRNYDSLQSVRE